MHDWAGLVQTLLHEDLVDELRRLTYPVVLGAGKRLIGAGAVPRPPRSVTSTAMPAGTVATVDERDGEPRSTSSPWTARR